MIEQRFIDRIGEELSLPPGRVAKAIQLMDEGATIPFVARYRKDVTGNLDEVKLEAIAERNNYFIGLTDRRKSVLDAIEKQGKLTDELRQAIDACFDKTALEDIYLPYKKKRRTKATVAREKGLEPLADFLWAQDVNGPSVEEFAQQFVKPEKVVNSLDEALEGARHILAERISLDRELRHLVRDRMFHQGRILAHPTKNAEEQKTKYESYYKFSEPVATIPSHRLLAVLRGVKEGVLRMELGLDDEGILADMLKPHIHAPGTQFEEQLKSVFEDGYFRLLRPSVENEVLTEVRTRSEEEAIRVFRENAKNLLLAAPAGQIIVLGVDPGMRTGCKLAVVDSTGVFLEGVTVFPTPPQNDVEGAESILLALIQKHNIQAIAIGNGTASRETARFVKTALGKITERDTFSVFVSEAGASVYSTSKVAREEFPELDATVRSAISIARRLQDPLSELVKVEPRSIGVGQYQHDVNQKRLREGLHRTVVTCVNQVGVDLNTASEPLLRYVSGIQAGVAKNIVEFRTANGGFKNRQQLNEVDGIGPKVFQQCAGFLRIANGDCALDATGIHPEAYSAVEAMAGTLNSTPDNLLKEPGILKDLDLSQYQTGVLGELTLADVREELMKPGRDPRTEFRVPKFLDGVDSVADLEEGMESEGVVTNVTDFGAFIDIGVHQDGLVHLSELAHRFVQDPRHVVRVGDIVRVKVIKVDKELPRISLSMKALTPPPEHKSRRSHGHKPSGDVPPQQGGGDKSGEPRPSREGRPRRKDDRGSRRSEQGRRRGPKGGGKDRRKPDSRGPGKGSQKDDPLVNTQLADQLAALKDKFN